MLLARVDDHLHSLLDAGLECKHGEEHLGEVAAHDDHCLDGRSNDVGCLLRRGYQLEVRESLEEDMSFLFVLC